MLGNLPETINVGAARLPAAYENAKVALSNCASLDECRDWANKAEALASYAKQADDDSLRIMADRIQARAVRRCGELLKQYDARGGDRSKNDATVSFGRHAAGREAGMSERQITTAVRVANVPEPEFNRRVESEAPPTVTRLAEMGTRKAPEGFKQATHLIGTVRRFAEFCKTNNPTEVANGVMTSEAAELRALVGTIDGWLDRFVVNLSEG